MNNFLKISLALGLVALIAMSCSRFDQPVKSPTAALDLVYVGDENCADIYAGQNIPAGSVCITVDNSNSNVIVTYTTFNGWQLVETHLWGDDNQSTLPTNKGGNPVPGQFPYASGNITGATEWTCTIPFSVFGLDADATECSVDGYFAAHAALQHVTNGVVDNTQTGWAGTDGISGAKNWSRWFSVHFSCSGEPSTATRETAYAYNQDYARCFRLYDKQTCAYNPAGRPGPENFTKWGWTNGSLSPRETAYVFDIYAGAGQCVLTKGVLVGSLTVSYNGTAATVTYTMNSPYTMDEIHLYVGTTELYDCTIAPGQFPFGQDLTKAPVYSHTFTGFSNDYIWVIAHSVVCSTSWPIHEGDGGDYSDGE
jgi:hypothetical protein